MTKVYTVHAYRWGDPDNHSYLVDVTFDKQEALETAEAEACWRGGKYECEVREWQPGTKNADGSPGGPNKEILMLPAVPTNT